MNKLLSLLALFLCGGMIIAQKPELEKTYEISGKAKRGVLGQVEYLQDVEQYRLTYTTKSNERRAKFEMYYFDKDFNFLKTENDEIEFEKIKTKYSWHRMKKETYERNYWDVRANLLGTLVLEKYNVKYKWSWYNQYYTRKSTLLEKLKPKTDEGSKYFAHKWFGDPYLGGGIVLASPKDKTKINKDFEMIVVNGSGDISTKVPLKFDFPQLVVSSTTVTESIPNEDGEDDIALKKVVIIFAPMKVKGGDPNPNNLTYVILDNKGNTVFRKNLEAPSANWDVSSVVDEINHKVYFYGPVLIGKKPVYFSGLDLDAMKSNGLQIFRGDYETGNIDYIQNNTLDEINAKINTPVGQKKSITYEGKKFAMKNHYVTNSGEMILYGQNFKISKEGNKYQDCLSFIFDNSGKIKVLGSVDSKETNKYAHANGVTFGTYEGKSGNLYMNIYEIDDIDEEDGEMRFLIYPRIVKLDKDSRLMGELLTLGKVEKKTYYLDNKFPYLPVGGNKIVYFGNNKTGKYIWFCRIAID